MKNILFLLLLFVAVASHGQETELVDINQYVRSDFVRSFLDLRPTLDLGTLHRPAALVQPTRNSFLLIGDMRLGQVRNTRTWQSQYTLGVNLLTRSSNSNGSFIRSIIDFGGVGRYFHRERQFLILSTAVNLRLENSNTAADKAFLSARGEVGYGFGRIEFVGDAVHVFRLIRMLKDQGVLLADPSAEQLKELVDIVATNKNKRFFDFRLQLIRETEAVLAYMSENGLADATDFRTFVLLKDAYDYENAFQAFRAGQTVEFTVGREAAYDLDQGWLTGADFIFSAVYNNYYMINNYSEKHVYGGVDYLYFRGDFGTFIQHRHAILPFLGYEYSCMPTIRVRFTWDSRLQYNINLEQEGLIDQNRRSIVLSSVARLEYYVSPQVRVAASGILNTTTVVQDATNSLVEQYNLGVQGGVLYSIY